MKFSNLFFIVFITIFLPYSSQAATCNVDNTISPNGPLSIPAGAIFGQQFIACETGTIDAIKVQIKFQTAVGGAVDLYLVEGNGSTITVGSPLKTFAGQTDGLLTLTLDPSSFSVTQGNAYAFGIGGADIDQVTLDMSPVGAPANPDLPNGLFAFGIIGGTFSEQMPSDLLFAVSVNFTPPAPIPTMSEWGLMIFGLVVLNLGVLGIRRKELEMNNF